MFVLEIVICLMRRFNACGLFFISVLGNMLKMNLLCFVVVMLNKTVMVVFMFNTNVFALGLNEVKLSRERQEQE